MERTDTTCARHPETPTRLGCSQCGTPICPRCTVATPVGQKCPECARQPRSARAAGKPRQVAKGIGAGLVAAGAGAVALMLVFGSVGFFTWILSGVVGYGVTHAVLWGAEGNRAPVFRRAAYALTVLAVLVGWLLSFGVVVPGGLNLVTYLAAGYGAYLRLNR